MHRCSAVGAELGDTLVPETDLAVWTDRSFSEQKGLAPTLGAHRRAMGQLKDGDAPIAAGTLLVRSVREIFDDIAGLDAPDSFHLDTLVIVDTGGFHC